MMAAKEKINLLEIVPCRSEHITAKKEGETIVLSFPRFKSAWMQRFLIPKGMSKELHVELEAHGTVCGNSLTGSVPWVKSSPCLPIVFPMMPLTTPGYLPTYVRCRRMGL